jgi:hypothetical protein
VGERNTYETTATLKMELEVISEKRAAAPSLFYLCEFMGQHCSCPNSKRETQ